MGEVVVARHRWAATGHVVGPKRNWKFSVINLLVAFCTLAGATVFTYPTGAQWVTQYNQSNIIFDQARADALSGKDYAEAKIKEAHEYNQFLKTHAILASGANIAEGLGANTAELDYREVLDSDQTGIMARLRMRSIDLDLPVYHGTSADVLLKGVGHLQGTSLPVGGEGTRAVLTGHRGLAGATIFTNLDKVKEGDTFTVEVMGEVFSYRVFDIRVVAPDETEEIRAVPGKDLVTLITCTPLGINSHRILVTGERIIPTPQEDLDGAGAKSTLPHFPWWIILYILTVLAICLWYWRSGFAPKRRKQPTISQNPFYGYHLKTQGMQPVANLFPDKVPNRDFKTRRGPAQRYEFERNPTAAHRRKKR